MKPQLSIVVPTLNEADQIGGCLSALDELRKRGIEVIVVDGGSRDATLARVGARADVVRTTRHGRARQMNAGAAAASGDILLFLHADTRLPHDADRLVIEVVESGALWGRFDVRIEGRPAMLWVVSTLMNWRSRVSGIATGDQAIFVRRATFIQVGGFPIQPLMEDIEMSRRLRALDRPACIPARVTTSGRRWETHGVWRTIGLMWKLRWHYWRGASAHTLARRYR